MKTERIPPNNPNGGKTWTEAEEVEIVDMLRRGCTLGMIVDKLGRSLGAIEGRIEQMAYKKQRLDRAIRILTSSSDAPSDPDEHLGN